MCIDLLLTSADTCCYLKLASLILLVLLQLLQLLLLLLQLQLLTRSCCASILRLLQLLPSLLMCIGNINPRCCKEALPACVYHPFEYTRTARKLSGQGTGAQVQACVCNDNELARAACTPLLYSLFYSVKLRLCEKYAEPVFNTQ